MSLANNNIEFSKTIKGSSYDPVAILAVADITGMLNDFAQYVKVAMKKIIELI